MFTLIKSIRDCFNYYVFGRLAPEMIEKINDNNNITIEVKENLVVSIMQNNPAKLLEQINDDKNNLPIQLKENLNASIMFAIKDTHVALDTIVDVVPVEELDTECVQSTIIKEIPTFKCVLVGDGGVGKSAFVQRHLTGEFVRKYTPTLGVAVTPIVFDTTDGPVRFNVWDCAGQERYSSLSDEYYIQADCAIVMFSLTSKMSFLSARTWINKVQKVCGNIPIILVGSVFDVAKKSVTDEQIMQQYLSRDKHLKYYSISTKSNYNLGKPFEELTQQLLGCDVNFV